MPHLIFGIRAKLLLAVGLVLLASFGVLAGVTLRIAVHETRTLEHRSVVPSAMNASAERMAAFYRANHGWNGVDGLLASLALQVGSSVLLIDPHDRVIDASSPPYSRATLARRSDGSFEIAVRSVGSITSEDRFVVSGAPMIPVEIEGRRIATLLLMPRAPSAGSLSDVTAQIDRFNRTFFVAFALVALCALAGSLFLAGRIVTPIKALTSATKSMDAGKLDARVAITSRDEIGELAHSFNDLADRLQRSESLRKNLVTDIAHELRTPLTNIRCAVESLQDGLVAPSADELASILGDVLLLQRLVTDLHELSLADLGFLKLDLRPSDIVAEARAAVAAFGEQIAARGIHVNVVARDDVPSVTCDGERIRQVMHNILSNALRYTADGGSIETRIDVEGTAARISVSDDGAGYPAAEAAAIFDRFHRVDASRSRDTGGTGLGLAIAKQIIEAHGGSIGAHLNDRGGATIWFSLPAD
jgi:two-component system sensor histidine kinase BaeS